jgi:hypothetical protein
MSQNRAGTESAPVLEIRVEVVPSSTECEMLHPCYNPVTSISTAVQRLDARDSNYLGDPHHPKMPSIVRKKTRFGLTLPYQDDFVGGLIFRGLVGPLCVEEGGRARALLK